MPSLASLAGQPWIAVADVVVRATLLLALAATAAWTLKRASASARHAVWTIGLAGCLVVPLLAFALPRWEVPVVVVPAPVTPASRTAPDAAPAATSIRIPVPERHRGHAIDAPGLTPSTAAAPADRTSWTRVLLAAWLAGAAVVLGRLLLGLAAVAVMSRRTERVTDARWLPLARQLEREVGIDGRVTYLRSRAAAMPMAWGVLRSAVLMPAEADAWPETRLRVVLLHELAHVRRRDCLTHALAQIACAVHWFNPLVWIAARRARVERERACDDLVLAAGTRGSDYANHLLEIARALRAGRFPAILAGATLAMAHRSQLEGRLMAILDTTVRRSPTGRKHTVFAAAIAAAALVPLASVQPWAYASGPAAPAQSAAPRAAEPATVKPAPEQETSVRGGTGRVSGVVAGGVRAGVPSGVAGGVQSGVAGGVSSGVVEGVADAVTRALADIDPDVEQTRSNPNPNPKPNPNSNATPPSGDRKPADPRVVAALTAALKDTDKEVRESAMHALIQLRDPSIYEPLVQALRSEAADVREQAAFGLGQIGDKRAVAPLVAALKDSSPDVREQVVFALGQLGDPAAAAELIAALRDADADVREQAAFALGQIGDPRAVEALIGALKDAQADVREQAAFALGQIGDARAIDALTAALKDTNPEVRRHAAFALGQIAR
jgi:beta-lactamase regulating signal transducer with metallopeptidase domain